MAEAPKAPEWTPSELSKLTYLQAVRFDALLQVLISKGIATTQDLRFEAGDVDMSASGTAHLDASALNLRGQLQLSDSLSRQVHQTMRKFFALDNRRK